MRASDPGAREALVAHFGNGIVANSSLYMPGTNLSDVLAGKHYGTIMEIGTFQGISAAILAEHADRVITLDIAARLEPAQVWQIFGVSNKIIPFVVSGDIEKHEVVSSLSFDMCFIDGDHARLAVQMDFVMARSKCNEILFHDWPFAVPWGEKPATSYNYREHWYDGNGDGVGYLLDCIQPAGRILRVPPFAWWFAQGNE